MMMTIEELVSLMIILCLIGVPALIIAILEWFSPKPPQWVVNVKMWWRYRK